MCSLISLSAKFNCENTLAVNSRYCRCHFNAVCAKISQRLCKYAMTGFNYYSRLSLRFTIDTLFLRLSSPLSQSHKEPEAGHKYAGGFALWWKQPKSPQLGMKPPLSVQQCQWTAAQTDLFSNRCPSFYWSKRRDCKTRETRFPILRWSHKSHSYWGGVFGPLLMCLHSQPESAFFVSPFAV